MIVNSIEIERKNVKFEAECPHCGEVFYTHITDKSSLIKDAITYPTTCTSCNKNSVMYIEIELNPHCLPVDDFIKMIKK